MSLPMPTSNTLQPSDAVFRTRRLNINGRRVRDLMTDVISSIEGAVVLGDDPLVSYCVSRTGTAVEDVVVCQVLVEEDLPLTIVSVPKKIWYRRARMDRLQKACRALAKLGRRCAVIPHTAFTELLGTCGQTAKVRVEDMAAVERCSRELDDPLGCIAHLLTTGTPCWKP